MFVDHQKWRRSFIPLGYIPEEDVSEGLQDNRAFLQGHDRMGRPVAFIPAAKHFPGDAEKFKRNCHPSASQFPASFLVFSFARRIV